MIYLICADIDFKGWMTLTAVPPIDSIVNLGTKKLIVNEHKYIVDETKNAIHLHVYCTLAES